MEENKLALTTLDESNNTVIAYAKAKYGLNITKLSDLDEIAVFINYVKKSLENEFLENYNGKDYEDDFMTIKYEGAYTQYRVDSKGLKAEMPDVYELYTKPVNCKAKAKVEFK